MRELHPLENLSTRQGPFELPNELLEVVLYHPVEVDQVTVDVVEHLGLGGHRRRKYRAAPPSLC